MSYRTFTVSIVLMVGLCACGKSGDSGSDDGNGSSDGGGPVEINPKEVSGRFFFESTDSPAADLDLVLVDWVALSMKTFRTRADGSVSLPLSEFNESGRYSFHLTKGDQKIGDLDLSVENDGLQSAFTYRGGYGFELGDVIIPKDERGVISVPFSGLAADIGGGFSLYRTTDDLRIEDFPVPDLVSNLDVKPALIVSDPVDLLYGFLNVLDSTETGRALAKYNAIAFHSRAKKIDDVVRIFVSREASWHVGATLLPEEFFPLSSAVLWRSNSLYLTQSGTDFSADVLPGVNLVNRLIFLKIEGQQPPQIEVPRLVSAGYSRPPLLVSVSLSGGTPVDVDYTDVVAENGLTVPFCYSSGGVVSIFSVPRDIDNVAVDGATLEQIALSFDYYSQTSGVTSKIDGGNVLLAPYNKDIAEQEDGLYLKEWKASGKQLLRTMTEGSVGLSSHTVSIPNALLPATFGGKSVKRIRVKLLFKSKNHPGKSGSVFWLDRSCA